MGTRSEIYVRRKWDKSYFEVVELWKHWDGYPEYILPYLRRFTGVAKECVKDQKHWLTYPRDIASPLIAFDYEQRKKECENLEDEVKYLKPDIRPKSDIRDAAYAYIIDLPKDEDGMLKVSCYKLQSCGLSDDEIRELREGKLPSRHDLVEIVKISLR